MSAQLQAVKTNLGITGTYQDKAIQGYIDEVKLFLLGAGVPKKIVESDDAIGVITRGVSDLWNYGNGSTDLSPYFIKRATQLACKKETKEEPSGQV